MERLVVDDRHVVREQNEPQIRNTNFRKPRKQGFPPPHILQRGKRNQNRDQNDQVRPPFQGNMLEYCFTQWTDDHINQFGDKESKVFLTKEEHDGFTQDFYENKSKDRLDEY